MDLHRFNDYYLSGKRIYKTFNCDNISNLDSVKVLMARGPRTMEGLANVSKSLRASKVPHIIMGSLVNKGRLSQEEIEAILKDVYGYSNNVDVEYYSEELAKSYPDEATSEEKSQMIHYYFNPWPLVS